MYEKFYDFTGMPFQLTPDSRLFFGSSGHSRAIAHLIYGLSQGEGFIVVTGEVGAGKTTLVERLWSELDRDTYTLGQDQHHAGVRRRSVPPGHDRLRHPECRHRQGHAAARFRGDAAHLQRRRPALPAGGGRGAEPVARRRWRSCACSPTSPSRPAHRCRPSCWASRSSAASWRAPTSTSCASACSPPTISGRSSDEETRAYIEYRLTAVGWNGNPHLHRRRVLGDLPLHRRHPAPDQPAVLARAAVWRAGGERQHHRPDGRQHRRRAAAGPRRVAPAVPARPARSRPRARPGRADRAA